jgi:hypothetical protein
MTEGVWWSRRREYVPVEIDVSTPSVARMYDYYLGGKDNFSADRQAAEQILARRPAIRDLAQANRAFLSRSVRFLAGSGVRQFLDIGAGLPTQENVHQVAQRVLPGSRVVYVDHDPMVLTHGLALLTENSDVGVIQADLLRPDDILDHPTVRTLLDFEQPMALLLFAVLHFIPDQDGPHEAVARLREAMAPGSYLALSCGIGSVLPGGEFEELNSIYRNRTGQGSGHRTAADVSRFFEGFELVEPGLVHLPQWRPDRLSRRADPAERWIVGGVGRKA